MGGNAAGVGGVERRRGRRDDGGSDKATSLEMKFSRLSGPLLQLFARLFVGVPSLRLHHHVASECPEWIKQVRFRRVIDRGVSPQPQNAEPLTPHFSPLTSAISGREDEAPAAAAAPFPTFSSVPHVTPTPSPPQRQKVIDGLSAPTMQGVVWLYLRVSSHLRPLTLLGEGENIHLH